VSYAFVQSGKKKLGYAIAEVDAFLELARQQYNDPSRQLVRALDVRSIRFKLVKNGYSMPVVDVALEKLEDSFAASEFTKEVNKQGFFEFEENLDNLRKELFARCSRASRKKFSKRKFPNKGYYVKQVDEFCSQLGVSLETKGDLSVKEVRTATFKSKRGGYAESQVDAFLESVVESIQRQQAIQKSNR
jgi:DivIVA domain-containing protein